MQCSVFLTDIIDVQIPNIKIFLRKKSELANLTDGQCLHFLVFFITGFLFPQLNTITLAFLFGVFWELFEFYYGKYKPGWLGQFGDCKELETDKLSKGNWWYGKWSDILMNFLGLLFGFLLSRLVHNNGNKIHDKNIFKDIY